jgi:predicted  nucleic acid-binding Zn-ribbon protein
MPSPEIARLWKLAQIDSKIAEIRSRAANFDVGQREQASIDALAAQLNPASGNYKGLQQEILDLELSQESDEAKRKKFETELFGGKVVNPREVANLEKEIEILKKKRDKDSEKLLNLYDLVPAAQKAYEEAQSKVDELKATIAKKRAAAAAAKPQLEEAFKKLAVERPEAAKAVPVNLLNRYETLRKNHGGVGMVEVDKKTGNCGGCGTHLPVKTIESLKQERLVSCEACHRILYYTEGVV